MSLSINVVSDQVYIISFDELEWKKLSRFHNGVYFPHQLTRELLRPCSSIYKRYRAVLGALQVAHLARAARGRVMQKFQIVC